MTRGGRKPGPPPPGLLSFEAAAAEIAGHIADRTAFIVSVPPALTASAAGRLAAIRDCRWYADNGEQVIVLAGRGIAMAAALDALAPGSAACVAVIPKTVSAGRLSRVLGQEIPADGSQDLIVLKPGRRGPFETPVLLVQALDQVYPGTAAAYEAADVRRLS